jgi:ABC-type glycerol-3-phosphate transport system substrate-binding protein
MVRRVGWIAQVLIVVGLCAAMMPGAATAQEPIRVVSHRYPALEYYAKAMEQALPGQRVEVNLMPQDRAVELATLTLSQHSDAHDVVWGNAEVVQRYARAGWLEPLDEFWARHRAQFKLDDFPAGVLDAYRVDGKLYAIPFNTNVMFFFYRADIFQERGLKPPTSFEEYLAAAQALNSPRLAGTIMSLKPVDAALNEIHWYMDAFDQPWFDAKWQPLFNGANGVRAVEMLRQISKFAPPGFTAHANDESTVNLQQGLAAMGLQWASRAAAMDDPQRSRIPGRIQWTSPPGGGQRVVLDGYAISRYSRRDKDTVFRMLATASSEDSMRRAGGMLLPPRAAVLNDPQLQQQYRHWPAALKALEVARPYPALPEFLEAGEIITRRVLQAVTGEMPTQAALDAAAGETRELLQRRGYYR